MTTVSTSTANSSPVGTGRLRPLSSGSPTAPPLLSRPRPAVAAGDFLRPQPYRRPDAVHRRVAAADDQHPVARVQGRAQRLRQVLWAQVAADEELGGHDHAGEV